MIFVCQNHKQGQSEYNVFQYNVFQSSDKALLLANKHKRNKSFITRPKLVVIIQNAKQKRTYIFHGCYVEPKSYFEEQIIISLLEVHLGTPSVQQSCRKQRQVCAQCLPRCDHQLLTTAAPFRLRARVFGPTLQFGDKRAHI